MNAAATNAITPSRMHAASTSYLLGTQPPRTRGMKPREGAAHGDPLMSQTGTAIAPEKRTKDHQQTARQTLLARETTGVTSASSVASSTMLIAL